MATFTKSLTAVSIFLILMSWSVSASAQNLKSGAGEGTGLNLNFDGDKVGGLAKGLLAAETAGAKKPAAWQVVADSKSPSKPNVFGITKNENFGHTFNLAVATGSNLKDLELSVKVKAVAGKEDQGGGPIWRAQDENNYYIARWNPLEDNFRVYVVIEGRRKQLKSAKIKLDAKKWHAIRVVMQGEKIECSLNGRVLLMVSDKTFKNSGMVGLWVKADGLTLFDDLVAAPAK